MKQEKILKSNNYMDFYAEFASFAPTSASPGLINIQFITNKLSPSIFGQSDSRESGKTDFKIGAVSELIHECSIMMDIEQIKVLRNSIDHLIEQIENSPKAG